MENTKFTLEQALNALEIQGDERELNNAITEIAIWIKHTKKAACTK